MRTVKEFPIVTVEGDPYNIGLQHGSKLKDFIRKNIDLYFNHWQTNLGLDKKSILNETIKFALAIEKYDSEILKELEGVADGSGASLEEILAINARYELIWLKEVEYKEKKGCTSCGVLPEFTSSKHTLIGQNWDYKVKFKEQCVVLEIKQEKKPNILMHTEAGIIGQKGLNSSGIGLCINAMVSNLDKFEPKTPFLMVCRQILNSENFGDAIGAVLKARMSVSGNFLIGHSGGEIIDLEALPVDVAFINPEDGILTHSNNFLRIQYFHEIIDKFKEATPDSLFRFDRARRLLAQKKGKVDIQSFEEVLRDHFNYPCSICCHAKQKFEEETIASVIMDLNDRLMYISHGTPCVNEYMKYSFNGLKKED